MESRWNKTPYNSIYEPIRKTAPRKADSELCCCLHGAQCIMAKAVATTTDAAKADEDQYVNLLSPSKEEKMASQLANKLNKLAIDDKVATKKTDCVRLDTFQQSPQKNLQKPQQKTDRKPAVKIQKVIDSSEDPSSRAPSSSAMTSTSTSTSSAPASSSTTAPPTDSTFSKVSTKSDVSDSFRSCAASIYLGVMSKTKAQAQVNNPTEFALYHHFSEKAKLDSIHDGLPLILVYRTSSNEFRHYPVQTTASTGGDVQYFVNYGRANVRKHWSLNQLVKYYQTHVSFDPKGEEADIFSFWHE